MESSKWKSGRSLHAWMRWDKHTDILSHAMWCALSEYWRRKQNTNSQEDYVHIHLSSVEFHVLVCWSSFSRCHWCRTFHRSVSPRIRNSRISSWCCCPTLSCHHHLRQLYTIHTKKEWILKNHLLKFTKRLSVLSQDFPCLFLKLSEFCEEDHQESCRSHHVEDDSAADFHCLFFQWKMGAKCYFPTSGVNVLSTKRTFKARDRCVRNWKNPTVSEDETMETATETRQGHRGLVNRV